MELWDSQVLKFFIAIISILNPLGVIPIFLNLTDGFTSKQISKTAQSCSIAVGITIIASLAFGQSILDFFSISLASFKVGGGILVATNAFAMLKGRSNAGAKLSENERAFVEDTEIQEMGIVPLAIPLLSGPGTISTAIIQGGKIHGITTWIGCIMASFLIMALVYWTLRGSRLIADKIGRLGLNVMTRIMGLILMAIAIESISSGIKILFQ